MSISSQYSSIRPSLLLDFANTEQLDPRITFARSTTATYYDDNTVAKAEENLLTYSQDFSNAAWAKYGVTISENSVTAPDGSSTADSIVETSATFVHGSDSSSAAFIVGNYYTFSVYAKANTATVIQLLMGGIFSSNVYANFDLSSGVLGTVGGGAVAAITSVGNGWYRCSIIATPSSSGTTIGGGVYLTNNSTTAGRGPSYAGNAANLAYIWGAQLEQRSTVTAYTPTTTQPITNYIPVLMTAAINEARLDHNPTTRESLGLLIEEQRTNLTTYSSQFDNAAWAKSNATITADTIVAPDGTLTGDKLVENTANSQHATFSFSMTVFTASSYTASVYAKASGRNLELRLYNGAVNLGAVYNLSTGIVSYTDSGATSTITPVGNGWYRCTLTATMSANQGGFAAYLNNGISTTYTGDGYSGIYIWGAQLEAGSFPTSYIPTIASQVTRSADSASMTGSNFSSWYRADEGTVYAEITKPLNTTFFPVVWRITPASGYGEIGVGGGANATIPRLVVVDNSNTISANLNIGSAWVDGTNKMSAAYKTNDFAGSGNGGATQTDTSGLVPSGMTQIVFGGYGLQYQCINSCIKRIAYYPARLTNAQLQAITS